MICQEIMPARYYYNHNNNLIIMQENTDIDYVKGTNKPFFCKYLICRVIFKTKRKEMLVIALIFKMSGFTHESNIYACYQ